MRDFRTCLSWTGALAALFFCAVVRKCRVHASFAVRPVSLDALELDESTWQARAFDADVEYLIDMLPTDTLLYCYRKNAGLETQTAAQARDGPSWLMGGWEACNVEICGQFHGHYMSALARIWQSTGDERVLDRLEEFVTGLQQVQHALGGGYLSAFPSEHFDRLQALRPVWAPYYVIHKIMAGLLDIHVRVGHEDAIPALSVLEGMATYFGKRVNETLAVNGTAHWQLMLNVEFGGMGEVLYKLYGVTGDRAHLHLAECFQKDVFLQPLYARQDRLAGNHVNTHAAQVNALAARFEATGDAAAREAVAFFFDTVTQHHAYATGGTSDHEFWGPPDRMADAIWKVGDALVTQETCTVYNMLKIARYLFTWTKDRKYADYYERALLNGILGAARLQPDLARDFAAPQLPTRPSHTVPAGALAQQTSSHVWEIPAGSRREWSRRGLRSERFSSSFEAQRRRTHGADADAALSAPSTAPQGRPSNAAPSLERPWEQVSGTAAESFGLSPSAGAAAPGSRAALGGSRLPYGPGQFIYYQPLGAGTSRNDSFFHWGNPYSSFWCCYGSSVESFSKVGDSIYFTEENAHVPTLYVTQFVSSALRWDAGGVIVQSDANPYAPDRGLRLRLRVDQIDADAAPKHLSILVRTPDWAEDGSLDVSCRHARLVTCQSGPGFPFIRFEGVFEDGDTVEVSMQMSVRLETIQDSREDSRVLKALLMGPYVMAGLTHGDRNITLPPGITPSDLAARLTAVGAFPSLRLASGGPIARVPGASLQPGAVVSFRAPCGQTSADCFLRHERGALVWKPVLSSGDALDASFRIVAARASLSPCLASGGCARSAEGGAPLVSLEPVTRPGALVGVDEAGAWGVHRRPNGAADDWAARHAFRVADAPSTATARCSNAVVLESAAIAGAILGEAIARDASFGQGVGLTLRRAAVGPGDAGAACVVDALGELPAGAHHFEGDDQAYLVVPWGNLVDARNTAYFEVRSAQERATAGP